MWYVHSLGSDSTTEASIGLQPGGRYFSAGVRKPNGTDFSEISRNTIRLARYLRNES